MLPHRVSIVLTAAALSSPGSPARQSARPFAPLSEMGAIMFEHATRMGLEGIVSKRKDSLYRSGRTAKWLKIKAAGYARHAPA